MTARWIAGVAVVVLTALGSGALARGEPFAWNLPRGFPVPRVPVDNPMTPEKVSLGRYLFYDTRLSANGTQSCATCHEQARAFTDGRGRAVGSTGQVHPRSSMSLANVAYASALTWGNPAVTRLEDQALLPMFGDQPIELGLVRPADAFLARLRSEPTYRRLFPAAFGDGDVVTIANVTRALAAFERTMISGRSPYDRYIFGRENDAISAAAKRGERLFFSESLACFQCHGGFTFTDAPDFDGRRHRAPEYQDNGLTKDAGAFKATTLRNVEVTAPYMHDGSLPTLEAVIDAYATGGRDSVNKSPVMHAFTITPDQKRDLIAFLNALTDEAFLHDAALADPWPATRKDR